MYEYYLKEQLIQDSLILGSLLGFWVPHKKLLLANIGVTSVLAKAAGISRKMLWDALSFHQDQ
ncbi:hypothetical protein DSO57_1037959 [Entomophthora muscae]|uniref:Uncharacterized protein n=1 Tax=Entomophthora muscae TaxID=34485 RepID=A0ACC2U8F8_9FUNG|nr:hypothetical protein DSO57_1037959 [Entomophthora muscae]